MFGKDKAAAQMMALLTPARPVFDSAPAPEAGQAAADYAVADLRMKAAAIVQEWAETPDDELAEGETLADRILAMAIGVADADKDGEISEAEAAVCAEVCEAIWDYLLTKGVSDEDCSALLNDGDVEAGIRIKDVVAASLPDDDAAAIADLDAFAFDSESDGAVFDAAYKKKVVVRGGRKMRVNKRVSGHVRLSPKQKVSIRKMLRKSHSAVATMHRMKSMKIRARAGL